MLTRSSRTSCACSSIALLIGALAACGDSTSDAGGGAGEGATGAGGPPAGGSPEGGAAEGGSGAGGMTTSDFVAGGDRPVTVRVPDEYDPAVPAPLLFLLHGYAATAEVQDSYFVMGVVAAEKGLVFAAPEGTVDEGRAQFWNATDACCDLYDAGVDDAGYLEGLIDEIETRVNIDPDRIYFVGHSNGGYMSYRMACDHADRIAAIASLAGATWADRGQCAASEPVSVLQIHGTADADVLYGGGENMGVIYPGAVESVERWVAIDGCDPTSSAGAPRDIEVNLAGAETTVAGYGGCQAGTSVELWTIEGGEHVPALTEDFSTQVVDWLLTRSK